MLSSGASSSQKVDLSRRGRSHCPTGRAPSSARRLFGGTGKCTTAWKRNRCSHWVNTLLVQSPSTAGTTCTVCTAASAIAIPPNRDRTRRLTTTPMVSVKAEQAQSMKMPLWTERASSGRPNSSPRPPGKPAKPDANGFTSTSRTTYGRSTSTPAGSNRQWQVSSRSEPASPHDAPAMGSREAPGRTGLTTRSCP